MAGTKILLLKSPNGFRPDGPLCILSVLSGGPVQTVSWLVSAFSYYCSFSTNVYKWLKTPSSRPFRVFCGGHFSIFSDNLLNIFRPLSRPPKTKNPWKFLSSKGFCFVLVIPLGFEPRTLTLKV